MIAYSLWIVFDSASFWHFKKKKKKKILNETWQNSLWWYYRLAENYPQCTVHCSLIFIGNFHSYLYQRFVTIIGNIEKAIWAVQKILPADASFLKKGWVPKNSLSQHSRTIFKLNLTCISLSVKANSSGPFQYEIQLNEYETDMYFLPNFQCRTMLIHAFCKICQPEIVLQECK